MNPSIHLSVIAKSKAAKQCSARHRTASLARNDGCSALAVRAHCSEECPMRFVRAIWKLLVGIKDALVLLLLLLFFAVLYAGLSARPEPVSDGVLALDLDGTVVEQPARAELSELAAGGSRLKQYRLRDLVA